MQQMAPAHQTGLPELDNPMVAALLAYTRAGNKLSNIDVIKAAMPDIGPDPVRAVTGGPAASAINSKTGDAVASTLMARADGMPSDPLQQMQDLSRAQDGPSGQAKGNNSVGSWWQQHRQDGQD